MEFKSKQNKVYKELRRKILNGEYPHLTKLPAEVQLCKELGVSRVTLRVALKRLEEESLIKRMRPAGTFVMRPEVKKKVLITHSAIGYMNHHIIDIISGIESVSESFNCEIIHCDSKLMTELEAETILTDNFKKEFVGVIAIANTFIDKDEPMFKFLKQLHLPVVLPYATPSDYAITGFSCIVPKSAKGWQEGLQHLIEQGHRRIASVVGTKQTIRGISKENYFKLLASHSASTAPELLKQIELNKENVIEAVKSLMDSPEPPTAIMCYSDTIAIYVYSALNQLNYRIPEDVAVMGFGGMSESAFLTPSLSTISYGYSECGALSLKLLFEAESWYEKDDVAPIIIYKDHKLIKRKSTSIKRLEHKFN